MKSRMAIAAMVLAAAGTWAGSANNEYLRTAKDAARWIDSTAVLSEDGNGVVWPADPGDPKSVNSRLYSGTPGPILFFLEAYRYTRETHYLNAAQKGADALLGAMKKEDPTGLYEGLAGTGFTLGEVYLFTKNKKYLDGALQCVDWLKARAKPVGRGLEWDSGNDIIAGGAGTGLFLLWANKELKAPAAHNLAVQAGERLVDLAQSKGSGKTSWVMKTDSKYGEMPNFSHGTAGVAYFLTTLYIETKRKEFLDAGIAGANYLKSIANTEGQICLIYHDDKHKDLYYLSWCHGPAGVARLFYQLYRATEDPQWMDWMKRSAKAMIVQGAPKAVVTPGEWNNVSMCCGVSAQAQFFLDMYQVTRDRQFLDLARNGTDQLLRVAKRDATGARWVQAEHRVKPDLLIAQTGYMQGASGVGMWLLHMSAFAEGRKMPILTFPDNPFPY